MDWKYLGRIRGCRPSGGRKGASGGTAAGWPGRAGLVRPGRRPRIVEVTSFSGAKRPETARIIRYDYALQIPRNARSTSDGQGCPMVTPSAQSGRFSRSTRTAPGPGTDQFRASAVAAVQHWRRMIAVGAIQKGDALSGTAWKSGAYWTRGCAVTILRYAEGNHRIFSRNNQVPPIRLLPHVRCI